MTPYETNIQNIIGNNLKIIRKINGLSLVEMGTLLGCTGQQVQKYEVGKNKISITSLIKFATHLNIPIAVFFKEITLQSLFNSLKNLEE